MPAAASNNNFKSEIENKKMSISCNVPSEANFKKVIDAFNNLVNAAETDSREAIVDELVVTIKSNGVLSL
ncbi:hypothetical protein G6F36_016108 [Rhizopus arrhizus]|nr:hypothetical protein G6F36_016108 [Rhizopus arrhizus]